MQQTLKALLKKECKKHIKRYHEHLTLDGKNQTRFKKRTGMPPQKKKSLTPPYWLLDNLFNPFYVLSKIDSLAFTLAKKIKEKTYAPKPCLVNTIPKKGGGERKVTIFTIPDAVVATYLYETLLARNFATLSSYAFAYRTDRNVHHAIDHLFQSIKDQPRTYILEYDFSKYFDSISHKYLIDLLQTKFKISQREFFLIRHFLRYTKAEGIDTYKAQQFQSNSVGIPQGSTISLFLANVACVQLDNEFEREGAIFARYSDDSVILCNSYEKANRCANYILSHGVRAGTKINFLKSDGISLLSEDRKPEIKHKASFDFCGHNISIRTISLRESTIKKMKTKMSNIINRHLIHYPKKYGFSSSRYSENIDWDLVTCVNEMRQSLYGGISEELLSKCLTDRNQALKFTKSAMSFYPLVNDGKIFKSLDGWLCDTLDRALNVRATLLAKYISGYVRPTKTQLIVNNWYSHPKINNETKLPSFYKAWLYNRKLARIYGIQKFPNPEYY